MNYYHQNLKALRQSSTGLYKTITESLPVYPSMTKFLADSHNMLVKTEAGECYLHSLYDQERELNKLFSPIPADTRIVILFGLGLGYPLASLSKHFSSLEQLVVIEPNLEAFTHFLTYNELSVVVRGCKKVSFIVNQTASATATILTGLLNSELYHRSELVAPISYRTLYSEYYQSVQHSLVEMIRRTLVNLVTKQTSIHQWLTNAWRNYKQDTIGIEAVMSRIMPLPVILVSAGPSLNKNIHLLEEAKAKALVIAVGSAMTILESHGITPHLRMAFDGNIENQLLFDCVDTAKCPLVYSDALYHDVLPIYHGEKLQMVLTTDYLTGYLRKRHNRKTILINSGFSIANIAFDLVSKWGCPKVILVGQDLCYTNNAMHADGSWSDGLSLGHEKRDMIITQDIYGQTVWTSEVYLGMKKLFEDMICGYKVDCINASEGGLPIAGSRNKPLRQVLDHELSGKGDITAVINKALKQARIHQEKNISQEIVAEIEADLDAMTQIYTGRMEVLMSAQAMRQDNQDAAAILKALEPLQQEEGQLLSLDFYREVIKPLLSDILQAIRMSVAYTGSDLNCQADALIKAYAGEAVELRKMISLNRKLLEEYKESQADPNLLSDYCLWLMV